MTAAVPQTETRTVPMLDVRAAAVPETYDADDRTVTFIASTGARGLRRRYWNEDYYEELEISESAIRMGRLNNGAPFLNSHSTWDVGEVIGVVERAWIEDENLMVSVRFSQRDAVAPILQDVADGVLRHVSVGYNVWEYEITDKQGELDIYRAIDWEPAEVSLVPIAFDDAAVSRSAEHDRNSQAKIVNRAAVPKTEGETTMSTKTEQEPAAATDAPDNTGMITQEEAKRQADAAVATALAETSGSTDAGVNQERKRVSEIQTAVRTANLSSEYGDELIRAGVDINEARKQIIDKLHDDEQGEDTVSIRAGIDTDVVVARREAVVEAIVHRSNPSHEIDDGARQYSGMSLLRLGEELLTAQGINTRGMGRNELVSRALTTSDLPLIAGSVMNRSLLDAYESRNRTFVEVFRQASAPDFRAVNRVRMSGAPGLEEVKENGEYKYGKITDENETYFLRTYGKILSFTREMLVNDDLNALTRVPRMFGSSAADLESEIVWQLVKANANMADGTPLFHANHGNVGTAGVPSETTLDEMEQLFMAQTGLEGRLISVMPRFLIVGPKHKVKARKLLASVTPDNTDNVNVYENSMDLVVEARLTGDSWYAAADHDQVDTIEYCYLEGEQGVYMETQPGFDTDGIKIKARHDFAAKAIDHRGLFRNSGA